MNPCDDRVPSLVDAAEGTVDASLDAHLAICARCRDALREFRRDVGVVRSTRHVPDDLEIAGFAARTCERAEAYRDQTLAGLWWGMNRANRWSFGSALAAFAAGLAFFLSAPQRPPPAVEIASARVVEADDDGLVVAEDDAAPTLDDAFSMLTDDEILAISESLDTSGT